MQGTDATKEPAGNLAYQHAANEEEERKEFLYTSGILANRAYGEDEPEYTEAHLIERNPNYRPE